MKFMNVFCHTNFPLYGIYIVHIRIYVCAYVCRYNYLIFKPDAHRPLVSACLVLEIALIWEVDMHVCVCVSAPKAVNH